MSLLQRIVDDALDPTYAEVAARRATTHGRSRAPLRDALAMGAALALLGVVVVAVVAETWRAQPSVERSHDDLVAQIQQESAADDALATKLQQLQVQVDGLRSQLLTGTGVADALQQQEVALSVAAGTSPVSGPGVSVVLDDGRPTYVGGGGPDIGRVLDRDVQLAVNGLFAAGAEAIDVNGQRITSLTAIRSAGDAILVGYRPLTRPYVIHAIGDPRTLEATFVSSEAGAQLQSLADAYGIRFDTATQSTLVLGSEPVPTLRFATVPSTARKES